MYSSNKNRFEVDEKMKKQRTYAYEDTQYKGTYRMARAWYYGVENLVSSGISANFEGRKAPLYNPRQNKDASGYTGDYKRKWIRQHEMHPSSNYSRANQDSEMVRESLRKWNILWTRINRNKEQPDAVTDKISKPKFDRKEAEIWND